MLDFISQKNTMVSKRGFGDSHPQQCIMVCFIFNFSFCFCFPKIDFTYNLELRHIHIQLKWIKHIDDIKLQIRVGDIFFSRITLKYLVNHVEAAFLESKGFISTEEYVKCKSSYLLLKFFFKKRSVFKIFIFFLEFEFIIFRHTICFCCI